MALSPQCLKIGNTPPLLPLGNSPSLLPTPNYEQPSQRAFVNSLRNQFIDCPGGVRPKIERIEGIALVEQRPIARIQLNSAEMCLSLCKKNTVII